MKITELSIGDWVRYDNGVTPYSIRSIVRTGDQECVVLKDDMYPDGITGFVKYLKPIPITPEILEKNGFEKVEPQWYMCEHNDIHISIIVWKNQRGRIEISYKSPFDDDNPLYIADFTANIPHIAVHHLQRILQLAGVEKEIIM